ncbi:MAG: tRNA (guanosine(37)-N1)-methyltransferase TrmD [Erysipelotrichaceae bacterium]|nr:tRNA (guanosine(37)-N1)-methyltransferase TrmD [Erysipelotrichaceae bacterium]
MKITILTLFPEFYESYLNTSIIKRAISKNSVEVHICNIRDYSLDKTKRVDDIPFGGGNGMLLKCQPVLDALRAVKTENSKVIYLGPTGKTLHQSVARTLSKEEDLVILCGHYEGIDQRILDYVDEVISIGDYILTGGEVASLVLMDSVIRLLDGAITESSHLDESFENGLLEYPQYTQPRVFEGKEVPPILFSGNHQAIDKWRRKESLKLTKEKRPDLFEKYSLTKQDKKLLDEIENNKVGKWEERAIEGAKKFTKNKEA